MRRLHESLSATIKKFEFTKVEAHDLQVAVSQYLDARGTAKASCGVDGRSENRKRGNSSERRICQHHVFTILEK